MESGWLRVYSSPMSSSSITPLPLDRPELKARAHYSAVLLALSLVLVAFLPTLISFPPLWLDKGGQGFVAAGFAGYLIWRDRERLLDFGSRMPEVTLLIAGLSMLWLVAYVLNVQVVHQASLPLLLLGWLLALGGVGPFLVALPITAVFFLAVPVWGVLIGVLQGMTIFVNGLLLGVSGIGAVISGEYIEIKSGIFWVAQGCAGLNYFETSLLISSMYALLFLDRWKYRFVAIALAVVLGLVSNWLRVFGLIVIGHVTEMQSPLIEEHAFYGWVIFAVAMLVFFALTRKIEILDRRAVTDDSAAVTTHTDALEPTQSLPPRYMVSSRALIAPTLAAVVGPVLFFALGGRSTADAVPVTTPGVATERSTVTPLLQLSSSDGLQQPPAVPASSNSIPAWRPLFDGADKHLIEEFALADATIRIDRLIYTEQDQGKELIGGENSVAADKQRLGQQVIGPLDETARMVNTTVVRTPEGARLIWHWYSVGGFLTHSSTRAKLMELIAFVRTNSPPAEFIAVSTLCGDNNCNAANRTLYEFVLGREPVDAETPREGGNAP